MPDFKKLFEERMYKINNDFFLDVESSGGLSKVKCNSADCCRKYVSILKEKGVKFTNEIWTVYLPTQDFTCAGIKYSEHELDEQS